jgi:hypothetical protein
MLMPEPETPENGSEKETTEEEMKALLAAMEPRKSYTRSDEQHY